MNIIIILVLTLGKAHGHGPWLLSNWLKSKWTQCEMYVLKFPPCVAPRDCLPYTTVLDTL